jgi:tRNA G18 (ribose-2'-O)-methylase SpoU
MTPAMVRSLVELTRGSIHEKARLDMQAAEGAVKGMAAAEEQPCSPSEGPSSSRVEQYEKLARKRQRGLTVVLEDLANPFNAAAVLRNCDAFGVTEVLFIFSQNEAFDLDDPSLHGDTQLTNAQPPS